MTSGLLSAMSSLLMVCNASFRGVAGCRCSRIRRGDGAGFRHPGRARSVSIRACSTSRVVICRAPLRSITLAARRSMNVAHSSGNHAAGAAPSARARSSRPNNRLSSAASRPGSAARSCAARCASIANCKLRTARAHARVTALFARQERISIRRGRCSEHLLRFGGSQFDLRLEGGQDIVAETAARRGQAGQFTDRHDLRLLHELLNLHVEPRKRSSVSVCFCAISRPATVRDLSAGSENHRPENFFIHG